MRSRSVHLKKSEGFFVDNVLRANKGLALLMFVILYTSFDTLIFGTLDMPIMRTIHDAGHILAGLICVIIILVNRRNITPLFVTCFLILLTCVINNDFGGGNFLLIIVLIISYCIASTISIKRFLTVFDHLFFYLVIVNLLLYGLYSISPTLFSFFPVNSNIVGGSYRIAFLTVFPEGDYVHLRNMSFFREPGVYMMYLNLAIIINLFSYEKPNWRNVAVYIIAMITTLSTAGYVVLLLILLVYYGVKRSRIGIFVILLLSMIFAVSYSYVVESDLFLNTIGKFSISSDKYVSAEARFASTTAPLNIMFNHPVFGTGLEMFTTEFERFALRVYRVSYTRDGGATNTLLNLGAIYGVLMLCIMLRFLFKFAGMIQLRKNVILSLFLFLAMLLMLSNEEVYYTVFFMTLIMYGSTKQRSLYVSDQV